MSIFSLSSLFNRFAKWAEKQPWIKLDKTLTQMERITSWRYTGRAGAVWPHKVKADQAGAVNGTQTSARIGS